ncbi:MAG: serine hydrolase domain-containing protein [Xanthobacteraceae bacterium]
MQKRGLTMVTIAAASSVVALTAAWPSTAPHIATGFIASVVCSETFVSGLDPDQIMSETSDAMPGVGLISWGIGVDVDRSRRQVTTTLFGGEPSRAVFRDGLGCVLLHDQGPVDASLPPPDAAAPPLLAAIAGPSQVDTADPQLRLALDRAFAEPDAPPLHHTKAVVVVKNGHVVAERYAPGYGVDTPILGWSATKSVVNALIGILVRQGKLKVDQPAPVAPWQDPDDPRHAITVDQLLRHTSGLAMGSSLNASLKSVLDPVNRMKYVERDMAGYAQGTTLETAPGTAWNYHDGNYLILSRIIRDAAGGHAADVLRLARQELFDPLGMRNVTLEFDATGTPEGGSQMLAPARDWARFGMLYLDDGVIAGKRVLPQGWVGYSAAPTTDAWVGYGAGFWTNLGDSYGAGVRTGLGMPRDALIAKGSFGKWVIIIPSERLVIVRFAVTRDNGDIDGVARLVTDVIAATRSGKVSER